MSYIRTIFLLGGLIVSPVLFAQGRNCTAEFKSPNQKSCDQASQGAQQKCSEGAVDMNGTAAAAIGMNDVHGVQVAELQSRWMTLAKAKTACDHEWIDCRATCMKVMQCLGGEQKRDPANAAKHKAEDDRIIPLYNDCNGKYQDFSKRLSRQMYSLQQAINATKANAGGTAAQPK